MEQLCPIGNAPTSGLVATRIFAWLLGLPILLAFTGVLGGQIHQGEDQGAAATLAVNGPSYTRSGVIVEFEIHVTARRALSNAAVEFSGDLWKSVTINTIFPSPESEKFENGTMRLEFGALRRGEVAQLKMSGQINPEAKGANAGAVVLRDEDAQIAAVPWQMWIWP